MKKRNLIFAIHDLNPRGGQDRSTLEIIQYLQASNKVEAHSFTFESNLPKNRIVFRPIWPHIRKPALLKIFIYHMISLWRFSFLRLRDKSAVICATGACSFISDIVHVQFVHASWNKKNANASFYQRIVSIYNLVTEKMAFSQRKKYIAISNSVKDSLIQEYGLENITVVYHGVDSSQFSPPANISEKNEIREALELKCANKIVLLYVGTFERKGLDVAIKGLAMLPTHLQKIVKLVAVGSGNKAKFEAMANEYGIGEQVMLLSPKSNIQDFFKAADVFILPTQYEPFGMVALEAMACGLPVILSRLAGASELVQHGVDGLLIDDPYDVQEVGSHIQRLVENDEQRSAMGLSARQVAEKHSWSFVAEAYGNAIQDFIQNQ